MQVEGETRLEVIGYQGGKLFTPAVVALCGLHIAGFVIPVLATSSFGAEFVALFGLEPGAVFGRLRIWQLVTHSMLYPTMCLAWTLAGTLVLLLFFGSRIEREWGTKRFGLFYVAMAAAAGLVRAIPEFGGSQMIVGSLGVVCALLGAYGVLFRGERASLLVSSVRVPHLVLGLLAILLLLNIQPPANALWLSGALFGLIYTRAWLKWERRRVRPHPADSDRFSQIDLGD